MADQTIVTSLDVDIIQPPVANREGIARLSFKADTPNEANMIFQFDVSSLSGKMWDSVVLRTVYDATAGSQTPPSIGPLYLGRVLRAINYSTCTGTIFDTASNWGATMAENSSDNDHSTRVDTFDTIVQGTRTDGDIFTSADITDIVRDAILKDSGTLNMIMYAPSSASGSMQVLSIEGSGNEARLFFTNVEDMESTTTDGTTATNVAVPSASVLSQSGRPPIAGADRQVTATILHDGVEPMTILSMTIKGEFGPDN